MEGQEIMEEAVSHMIWWSWLLGGVVTLVVGSIWYNPKVFGNAWMKTLGKSEEDLKSGNMPVIFGVSFVLSCILCMMLDATIEFIHVHPGVMVDQGMDHSFHTFTHGALHGSMFGILFILPTVVINALFERFNFKYMMIHAGYWTVCLAIMGGLVDSIN